MLTETQIRETIEMLSLEFNVANPPIEFGNTRIHINGRYRFHDRTIQISVKAWREMDAILHEFAHHLDCSRRDTSDHSTTFASCLKEVAQAYYGDASLYAWHTEYRSLRKFHITGKLTRTQRSRLVALAYAAGSDYRKTKAMLAAFELDDLNKKLTASIRRDRYLDKAGKKRDNATMILLRQIEDTTNEYWKLERY